MRLQARKISRASRLGSMSKSRLIRFEDGRFRFGGNCIGCVRCSFECPTGAIHIGLLDFMRVNGPYDFSRDLKSAVSCIALGNQTAFA